MISLHVLVLVEHVLAVSNWLGPHLAVKRHHHLVCISIVVIPWICHLALFDTNMCKLLQTLRCLWACLLLLLLSLAAAPSSVQFIAVPLPAELSASQSSLQPNLSVSAAAPLYKHCCSYGQESAQSLMWWALNPQVSRSLASFYHICFFNVMKTSQNKNSYFSCNFPIHRKCFIEIN